MASTTSTTSPTETSVSSYRQRLQLLRGERVYTAARWGVLAIFFLTALLVSEANLFSVSLDSLLVPIFWVYALFCILMTVVLFIPPLHMLFKASYILDVVFIGLLALTSSQPASMYLPLFMLPAIGIALNFAFPQGALLGILVGVAYLIAALGNPERDFIAIALHVLALTSIPWIVSTLARQWQANYDPGATPGKYGLAPGAQTSKEEISTLSAVATSLSNSLLGDKVLDTLFREVQKLVPFTTAVGLLPRGQESPGELYVAGGYNLSLVDPGVSIKISQGTNTAAALFPPAEPQLLADVSQEPDLQPLSSLRACRSACLISLRSGVHIYGMVLVARDNDQPFTSEQVDLLVALTHYATVALLNKELMIDVQKDRTDMVVAEEHARHWLAREIHDGLAQKLAAIVMNTEFIKRQIDNNQLDAAKQELDKLNDIFKRANYDVRTLLGELKPTTLETRGLPAALQEYVERLRTTDEKVKYIFEAKGVSGMTLPKESQGMLFNIVQESLNNARKYAEARHILLRLERQGYRLTITIQDDGKGFDVEKAKEAARARGSHGLSNLYERAKLINSTTEIVSVPGKGTRIRVFVPLDV